MLNRVDCLVGLAQNFQSCHIASEIHLYAGSFKAFLRREETPSRYWWDGFRRNPQRVQMDPFIKSTQGTHSRFLPVLVVATLSHCFCLLTAAALSCTLVRITEIRLAPYCSLVLRAVRLPLLRQVTQSNDGSEGVKHNNSRRNTGLHVPASLQSGNKMWRRRTLCMFHSENTLNPTGQRPSWSPVWWSRHSAVSVT